MRYDKIWNKVISPDERIRYEFSIGSRYLFIHLTVWAVIGIATVWIFGLGLVVFLVAWFHYGFYLPRANAYAFTTKRLLIHQGWLSTSVISLDYSKITEVRVDQSFLDRLMYKTGTLSVDTAGTAHDEIMLPRIQGPYEVKQRLSELMDESLMEERRLGIPSQNPF